jgi:hypothetical protein
MVVGIGIGDGVAGTGDSPGVTALVGVSVEAAATGATVTREPCCR